MAAPAVLFKAKIIIRVVVIGISICLLVVVAAMFVVVALDEVNAYACGTSGSSTTPGLGANGLPATQVGAPGAAQPGDPDPAEFARFLYAVRMVESSNDYTEGPPGRGQTATGAYQFNNGIWLGAQWKPIWSKYGNWSQARYAPPEVQDEVARAYFLAKWRRYGNWTQTAMDHYYPKYARNPATWDLVPRPDAGNVLTMRKYADKLLKIMGQAPDAPAGTDKASTACRSKAGGGTYVGDGTAGSKAVESATKYIGIGYTWGGGHGAGTQWQGMDCSSFTFNAYRDLGIRTGMTTMTQVNNGVSIGTNLADARPGDLVLLGTSRSSTSHVVMVHSIENGKVIVLESRGAGSACGAKNPKYGSNPRCRGIGPPHPFSDSRKIVDIRRIVCSVDAAGNPVPCGRA